VAANSDTKIKDRCAPDGNKDSNCDNTYQVSTYFFCRLKKMGQETEAEEKGRGGAHVSTNQLSVLQVEKNWSKRRRQMRRGGAEHI